MRTILALLCLVAHASAFDWQSEIPTISFSEESHPTNNDNIRINGTVTDNIRPGNWMKFSNFDFGTSPGVTKMWIDASKGNTNPSYLQIRLDSVAGPEIGSVEVTDTGGWGTFRRYNVFLSVPVTGNHDLYLTCSGNNGYLYNLRNFRFDTGGHFHQADIASSAFSSESHVNDDTNVRKVGQQIQNIRNQNWVIYNQFDFGAGVEYLWIEAATPNAGGTISLRLGSPSGPVLGSVNVTSTGSWTGFKPFGCKLSAPISGVQDLVLTFSGGSGDLFNLDQFRFQRLAPDHKPAGPIVNWERPVLSVLDTTAAGTFTTESHPGNDGTVRSENGKISYITANTWACYQNFDFGSGANFFGVNVGSPSTGTLELRIGNSTGTLIGTVPITNTGGFSVTKSFSANLTQRISGIQDLCFVFKGSGGYLFDVYSFRFQDLLPEAKSPGRLVAAQSFNQESHPGGAPVLGDGNGINTLQNGSWVAYTGFNFGQDTDLITINAATPNKGGMIEVRLVSPSGPVVANVDVTHTGSWSHFRPFTVPLSQKLSGVHDLVLKFVDSHNSGTSLFNVRDFVVGRKAPVETAGTSEGDIQIYPPVQGLPASPYYTYSVQKVSALNDPQKQNATNWLSPFAWFTECVEDLPSTPSAYYKEFIGGWSHTYCNFEMDRNTPIVVKITRNNVPGAPSGPISMANAYPAHKVESCEIINGDVYVTMRDPALVTIDIDGQLDTRDAPRAIPNVWNGGTSPYNNKAAGAHAVSIFANAFIKDKPDLNDPTVYQVQPGTLPPTDGSWKTLYFLPGIHKFSVDGNGNEREWTNTDVLVPRNGKSYYIPGDAIVYGNFNDLNDNQGSRNVRIFGHGTVSGTKIPHFQDFVGGVTPGGENKALRMMALTYSQGCIYEGITVADPAEHGIYLLGGSINDVPNQMKWIKNLSWRVNNDGVGLSGGTIEDCFLRHQDDALYVGGATVRRCVFWSDVNGTPFRTSFITNGGGPAEDVVVEDCDVIYARGLFAFDHSTTLGITGSDGITGPTSLPGGAVNSAQYLVYHNIRVTDPRPVRYMFGFDATAATPDSVIAPIAGLRFENVEYRYAQTWGFKNRLLAAPQAPMQYWYFDGASINGRQLDADHLADPSVFVTQNVANFVFRDAPVGTPTTYTLSTSASNGSMALDPPGGIYNEGTVVTLTATPNPGYNFDSWSGDASGTTLTTSVTMNDNKTVTALFAAYPTNQTIDTSGTTKILNYDKPGNTYIGDGTLQISSDGSPEQTIFLGTGSGDPFTVFSMTGGLITIDSDVRLVNGEFGKAIWTNNKSDMQINGILDLWDGQAVRVDALSGSGSIVFDYPWTAGARELVVGVDDGSGTFSGPIAGTHATGSFIRIIKEGAGTQTFDQLVIQNAKEIVINGGAVNVSTNTDITFAANLSGAGDLIKSGTGVLTLSGTVLHTGDTMVQDGTLVLPLSAFADSSSITIGLTESSPAVLHLPNPGTHIVAQLIIDGVAQAGNGMVYDSMNSGGAITGNGKIQVGNAPLSDYTVWSQFHGLLGGPNDDDDHDGRTNFEEYVFGLDPKNGSSANPIVVPLSGKTFSYTRRNPALMVAVPLTYSVWYSTTMEAGGWMKDNGAVEGTPTLDGDVETVPVTISDALLTNPKLFIQVRAE